MCLSQGHKVGQDLKMDASSGLGPPVLSPPDRLGGLAAGGAASGRRGERDWRGALVSVGFHAALAALVFLPGLVGLGDSSENSMVNRPRFDFRVAGGEGAGGGGGGGGSRGDRITAYIPVREAPAPTPEPEPETPREAPIAPRKPRPLKFEDLADLADAPELTDILLGGVYSPQATEFPGLSLSDFEDRGGRDTAPSAGEGGGIGGGEGIGTGEGQGWGVGPGYGGGSGGGAYSPGGYDVEPQLVFEPDEPPYPESARQRRITGEVMLQVLVKLDGSTEVLGVIKSGCRACVETARRHAALYRWKPALKDGKPVEAIGVISVTFGLFPTG